MTDAELEERVRRTLRAVAVAEVERGAAAVRPARRWPVAAAVAAVALVAGAVVVTRAGDETEIGVTSEPSSSSTTTIAPAPTGSPFPAGYDLKTATPVFSAEGTADDVALAFLASRFPDHPEPGVRVEPVTFDGAIGRARWSTRGSTEGELASGDLFLRASGDVWSLVAATTDGLDLSDLRYDGSRVHGTVRSTSDESFVVHLLDDLIEDSHDGTNPRSFGPATGALAVDREDPAHPVVVRISHVGGAVLSIAEVTIERPSTASTVVGDGDGWQLVATEESDGHWVTLRAAQLEGVFRTQTDAAFDSLYSVLGPCCRLSGRVAVVAAMRPDTTGMQVRTSNDRVYAAEALTDPATGVQYAIAMIPIDEIPTDSTARVEIRLADGTLRAAESTIDLTVIGG